MQCRVDEDAQMRLHSILHAKTLTGGDLVEGWRKRAAQYPDGLVHAMLAEYVHFRGFGYAEDMFATRGDALALYEIFVGIGQQVMGALMGLNRMYVPAPGGLKWMDESIAGMAIKPMDLSTRIKKTFRMDLADGVHAWHRLIDEVMVLVDQHMPAFNTTPYREQLVKRRQVWYNSPASPIK